MIDGNIHNGITNIGRKPTIEGKHPVGVETYIYDLDADLYDKWIEVRLTDFIRPEQRFSSVEALKERVLADKEAGRRLHARPYSIIAETD